MDHSVLLCDPGTNESIAINSIPFSTKSITGRPSRTATPPLYTAEEENDKIRGKEMKPLSQ